MDLNHFSDYMRLNYQIFRLISETSELRGMKNFAIQNRVLQRDRVLQRRVLERYYCTIKIYRITYLKSVYSIRPSGHQQGGGGGALNQRPKYALRNRRVLITVCRHYVYYQTTWNRRGSLKMLLSMISVIEVFSVINNSVL